MLLYRRVTVIQVEERDNRFYWRVYSGQDLVEAGVADSDWSAVRMARSVAVKYL